MQSDVYAWSWSSLNKSGTVNSPMALASPMHTRSFIMKIAALYARVSTSNQQQNETIASQLDALMAYAHAHDYEISPHHIYQDELIDRLSTPCVMPWQLGNWKPS
jgi:hypothetical protein